MLKKNKGEAIIGLLMLVAIAFSLLGVAVGEHRADERHAEQQTATAEPTK